MDEAKKQAADLLEKSNATIERTIREIKEAQAEKSRTQQARARVEQLKDRVRPVERQAHKEKTRMEMPKATNAPLRDLSDLRKLVLDTSQAPKVPKPKQPKMQTPKSSVTINYQIKKKADFSRILDLRGMRVDEALETFISYLDDAVMVNAGEVTILHGTGTGALKQVVRDYLNGQNAQRAKYHRTPFTFRDGDPDRGGAGLTIINV